MLDVYVDASRPTSPHGLAVGTRIAVRRALLRVSASGNAYCTCSPVTLLEVVVDGLLFDGVTFVVDVQ